MSQATAHILLSRKCVNNCIFCTAVEHRRKHRFTQHSTVLRYLRRVADDGIDNLVLSGVGEPTLDPHIDEYLDYAHGLGFHHIQLFTNGYGCTAKRVRHWRSRGLTSVLVSVHGVEVDHDRNVRRQGSFREALEAIRIYSDAGIRVSVNTCITRSNLEGLARLRKQLGKLLVDRHALSFLEWSGGVRRHPDIVPDYAEVGSYAAHLVDIDDNVAYFDNIPYCIVRRPTREMGGHQNVRLLQGADDLRVDPTFRKKWPDACRERACPFLPLCPGFEQGYLEHRGWQALPFRVANFLDEIEKAPLPQTRCMTKRSRPSSTSRLPAKIQVYIRATARCSVSCLGCRNADTDKGKDLEPEAMARFQQQLRDHCQRENIQHARIHWVGGDPLVLGRRFFTSVFDETTPWKFPSVKHIVNSNLLLIDEQWVALFKAYGCRLQTPVDPICDNRRMPNGKSAYDDWWQRFLQAYQQGLAVEIVIPLVDDHAGHLPELYFFMRNLQLLGSRRIPVLLAPGCIPHTSSYCSDAMAAPDPADFGRWVAELASLWLEDGMIFPFRPVKEWTDAACSLESAVNPSVEPSQPWIFKEGSTLEVFPPLSYRQPLETENSSVSAMETVPIIRCGGCPVHVLPCNSQPMTTQPAGPAFEAFLTAHRINKQTS